MGALRLRAESPGSPGKERIIRMHARPVGPDRPGGRILRARRLRRVLRVSRRGSSGQRGELR
eukprot:10380610-Alexandrium_andersonii.AAC.1